MLPKEKRLRNTKDYKRVYAKGSFFSVPLFKVNYLLNRTDISRIGVVVTKKVASKAVDRNKTKRIFREAVRKLYQNFPQGYDVIININQKALGKSLAEIEKEIKEAVGRIK